MLCKSVEGNLVCFKKEKRGYTRVPLDAEVCNFRYNGELLTSCLRINNVSMNGLCFSSQDLFGIGNIIDLLLPVPNYISVPITAIIVNRVVSDNIIYYGCALLPLNGLPWIVLKDYIESLL